MPANFEYIPKVCQFLVFSFHRGVEIAVLQTKGFVFGVKLVPAILKVGEILPRGLRSDFQRVVLALQIVEHVGIIFSAGQSLPEIISFRPDGSSIGDGGLK